ncbi:flagellar basal body rod protein FlgF [Roseateles sp. BYS78W]|uniref:Flagellar basal-body rod protein FlgF n=1 Tax=Pelomonas candidula TaxID=3299025 RepID=A0ABW7HGC9_9BURK
MDPLIYTVMSGAERVMNAQQVHANNLSNLNTAGFRANLEQAGSADVRGPGYADRVLSSVKSEAVSSRAGAVQDTGRSLDVAVQGDGYFAVAQGGADGAEGYTRAGSFDIDGDGRLMLGRHAVLGEGGPIVLPPHSQVEVRADGTVQVLMDGQTEMQPVDRLKLVRAEARSLTKNEAGLLVARDGQPLGADAEVKVAGGKLEGSNVSAVEEMVATMNGARDFDLQLRLFKAADNMADAGSRLIRD